MNTSPTALPPIQPPVKPGSAVSRRPAATEGALDAVSRAADALTVALLVLLGCVLVFGGILVSLGPVRISVSSRLPVMLAVIVVTVLRHVRAPAPPLHSRIAEAARRWRASAAVGAVLPLAVSTRAAVLLAGYLAVLTFGFPVHLPFRVSPNEFVNLPARWDTGWYLGIATDGYRANPGDAQKNIAFFPAYPILIRTVAVFAGARLHARGDLGAGHITFVWSAMAISLVCFYWGLLYVWRLARIQLGAELAGVTVLLMAAYPFAMFFSAAYTESLFLLTAAGAIYHYQRGELGASGAWGALAGLTRPPGMFLMPVLALIAVAQRRPGVEWLGLRWPAAERRRDRTLAAMALAACMPVLGVVAFSAYVYTVTGHPFSWVEAQQGWGRTFRGMTAGVGGTFAYIAQNGFYEYTTAAPLELLDVMATLLALVLLWPVARRLGVAYAVFVALCVLPPLFVGGFLSMGRFTSVLFPMFMSLAMVIPVRLRLTVVTAFAILQGFAAALFFTWHQFI